MDLLRLTIRKKPEVKRVDILPYIYILGTFYILHFRDFPNNPNLFYLVHFVFPVS